MSDFSNLMDQIKIPDTAPATIVPKPKPTVKKVKITNTGNEIKKMTARSNPPQKTVVQTSSASKPAPQDAPKPQSPPKKRKADRAASPTPTSKPATKSPTKKKPKITAAMKDITAANPRPPVRPVTKKSVVEAKDERDILHKGRDVLSPKVKKPGEQDERHRPALPQRSNLANATLSLQRMKNAALAQLKSRRESTNIALNGLEPLVEKNEAIMMAVAALEQQVGKS